MSSREEILSAIKSNRPPEVIHPGKFYITKIPGADHRKEFIQVLTGIGGSCREISQAEEIQPVLNEFITAVPDSFLNCTIIKNPEDWKQKTAAELNDVETIFIEGQYAVAENGAVWIPESKMINRLLPFICQHLVLLVREENILADMHEAYENIRSREEGYGAFIAGPSKTADIEQSLVIGAHGPLKLTVILVKKNS